MSLRASSSATSFGSPTIRKDSYSTCRRWQTTTNVLAGNYNASQPQISVPAATKIGSTILASTLLDAQPWLHCAGLQLPCDREAEQVALEKQLASHSVAQQHYNNVAYHPTVITADLDLAIIIIRWHVPSRTMMLVNVQFQRRLLCHPELMCDDCKACTRTNAAAGSVPYQ